MEVFEKNDSVRLALSENLDASTAAALRDRIKTLARTAGGQDIIVDLSKVPFIDSTGLAALVAGLRAVRQQGGDLVLMGMRPEVKRVFEITRLDRAFTFLNADASE